MPLNQARKQEGETEQLPYPKFSQTTLVVRLPTTQGCNHFHPENSTTTSYCTILLPPSKISTGYHPALTMGVGKEWRMECQVPWILKLLLSI